MIRLRPYQAEPARAVLADVRSARGSTFTVMMSRQAGKNELSAWLEKVLLTLHIASGGTGVKCAPTFRPQLLTSIERLRKHLTDAGYGKRIHAAEGFKLGVGKALWTFLSASPDTNVVGATASILLEADEAQDIAPDKFNKDFRPMAATTNATTVLYGTPWSDDTLLQTTIASNLERQRDDGYRRHFEYDWRAVAAHNPAYARYVEAERQRLGPTHPLFTTQYELSTLPGKGRLLSPAQLANIAGLHQREHHPIAGLLYVAGLDVAGEDSAELKVRDRDHNVLTIARVTLPEPQEKHLPPKVEVVAIYDWQGTGHDALYAQVSGILKDHWRVRHVAVDATAAGEAAAILLARTLGPSRVTPYRFTQQSKSHLGYALQASANTARLKLWASDGTPDHQEATRQLRLCRAEYRPNRTVAWHVDPADAHDDYVVSIALAVQAASTLKQRAARGRIPHKERI
ncbi:MAG: hypothetical protein A2W34_03965 [Chloroflexi bacterium RBG_16_64_32]|nr:MAG: hypothetical protein A2W34_03965 [Chloroflexi bacterium RBG_16_64_32]